MIYEGFDWREYDRRIVKREEKDTDRSGFRSEERRVGKECM